MAGYSGTPLAKKLGINTGCKVFADAPPSDYASLLDPIPAGVTFVNTLTTSVDVVHLSRNRCPSSTRNSAVGAMR